MNLRAYLRGRKEYMADFAARLSIPCSQAQISRLCSRQCIPQHDLLVAIYVATDGAVTPNDWYSLPDIGRAKSAPVRAEFAHAAESQAA
jgi:hypothetical protein